MRDSKLAIKHFFDFTGNGSIGTDNDRVIVRLANGAAGQEDITCTMTELAQYLSKAQEDKYIEEVAAHPAALDTYGQIYYYANDLWFKLSVADGGGAAGSATGATNMTHANTLDDITDNGATTTNNVGVGDLTASGNISGATYGSDGSVSDAELLRINSLTSNAQDQIDGIVAPATPVNAVAASETLTVSGVPSDNNTVTLGTTVYTFQNAIAAAGVKASSILTYSGVGADSETVVIDTTTYTYKTALTEAKGTATLTISNPVSDGETITINSRVYELDNDSSITGDVTVDISGGTKAQATETLELTGVCIEGETFTVGTEVFEIDADGIVTGANIPIDVSAFMVRSQGTLTLGGAAPANNETITVNSQVYTWKTTLTGAADEILIGGTIDDCIDNFTYCINAGIGAGVLYGTGTVANTAVTAAKTGATTSVLTAIVYGVIGDLIDTTETMGDGGNIFGQGTLGDTTAGVDCPAADADGVIITDFVAGTSYDITATQGAGTTVVFTADAAGALDGSLGNAIALDETMANGNWTAAAVFLSGGSDATANEASAAIHAAITGDGSAEVSSTDGTGSVVVTALVIGTVGNYVTAETLANGAWGGNLVGGLDAVVNEILVVGTAELSIDGLVAAATNGAGEGTAYSTGTVAHTTVDVTKESASELKAEFKVIGDAGNSTPVASTVALATWTGGTLFLEGGEGVESAYDVLIGATAELSIDNLVSAINGTAGEGTTYGTGTVAHPDVTASKASAATMDADAKIKGVAGNAIAIDESGVQLAWALGAVFLSGGVNGTVGSTGQILYDTTNLYLATAANTIADANWMKLTLLSI